MSELVAAKTDEEARATALKRTSAVHVCHVFPYPWYISGGPTNGLRGHIRCQVEAGISVEALSPGPDPSTIAITPPGDLGCDVTYVDFERRDLAGVVAAIRRRRGDDLLFNVNSVSDSAIKLARASRAQGVKCVHTSVGDLHFRSAFNYMKKFAFVNLLSRSVRGASGIHVLTQYEAARLKYLLPFWQGPTVVAPYVVEAPALSDCTPLRRSEVGIPEDGFLFMYLGRMDMMQKGLDILVRAFSMLPAKACRLALVGPNRIGAREGDAGKLQKLAQSLDCAERVHFAPSQEGQDKWRTLRMANAFVHPSRWDGFAMSAAESLACGIPTIISNRMNISPDVARHGAAAVVDLNSRSLSEEMRNVMESAQKREQLRKMGVSWVATHCSSKGVGSRFAAFYSALLESGNSSA